MNTLSHRQIDSNRPTTDVPAERMTRLSTVLYCLMLGVATAFRPAALPRALSRSYRTSALSMVRFKKISDTHLELSSLQPPIARQIAVGDKVPDVKVDL